MKKNLSLLLPMLRCLTAVGLILAFTVYSAFAQSPCTGNVPIENLANGMDYTITVAANGDVDVTVTVVDNPAGLVGFLGGPGGTFQAADANGTLTYSLTGESDPYTLDMFFNWAAGGQGNSESVSCASFVPTVCTGNVAIENLANGMDYSITVGANGDVDITVTVVDNPAGLVGFLGGPGGTFQAADANGTLTYSLTGESDPYTLDMFFNWAAGGQGNSESVSCGSAGPEMCMGNVPIENLANGMDYSITVDPSGDVEVIVTVVDNPAGLVGFLGGPGGTFQAADANGTLTYNLTGQTTPYVLDMFFNWAAGGQGNSETVTCPQVSDTEVMFCVDLSCFPEAPASPAVFGNFSTPPFDINQNLLTDQGGGIWCATVTIAPGTYEYLFFDQNQGAENFAPGSPCTVTNFGFTNRVLTVGTTSPQMETFGWESCGTDCIAPPIPPDFPIDFEDTGIDYAIVDFAGASSVVTMDGGNTFICTTKNPGAATFAGTVIADNGLANPIPFTMTETVITVDVQSPAAGIPVLLKIENSAGGPTAEVLATTTVAGAFETLAFDFSTSTNAPFSLANTYNKIVIFFDFGNVGTDPGQTFCFDNIMMCDQSILPEIMCPADVTISCDDSMDPMNTGMATGTDLCAEPTVTFADVSTQGTTGCDQFNYTITRTWTATDNAGNTATCEQIITVEDTTAPLLTCPADITIECDQSTDPMNTGEAISAGDNCAAVVDIVITFADVSTQGAAGCAQYNYTITRTFTATDVCGNTSTCEQIITVEDTTAPMITCPADVMLSCTDSSDPADTGVATGTDNCSADAEVVITSSDITTQDDNGCGQFTFQTFRTWTATDACGNTSTCVQTISTADTEAPVITCPPGQTLTCFETLPAPAMNAAEFIALGGTASDNCADLDELNVFIQSVDNGGDNCPGNARTVVRT
ncbi:MAG: hypothetical protein AB8F74_11230, partial [Saprospiraceae bacterium]